MAEQLFHGSGFWNGFVVVFNNQAIGFMAGIYLLFMIIMTFSLSVAWGMDRLTHWMEKKEKRRL